MKLRVMPVTGAAASSCAARGAVDVLVRADAEEPLLAEAGDPRLRRHGSDLVEQWIDDGQAAQHSSG